MPESRSHKEAKAKAAGERGKTEVPVKGGKRLDAATSYRAVEVEMSGDLVRLKEAAKRLKDSSKGQHVLIVPQKDIRKAQQAMREVGVVGTVKNLKGTKGEYVGAKTGSPPAVRATTRRGKK